jgi:hypothetical protein
MTDLITSLQARNSELVSENRALSRALHERGPGISAILYAYHKAIEKHQRFPTALDSQGVILAEEVLELAAEMIGAALGLTRAINDNRDNAPCFARVWEETTHVGAVALRMLGKLGQVKG